MIGFFVNTLVLRVRMRGEMRFEELVRRVREVCIEGYSHEEVPFEKVVEELRPERDLSRTPLFQVFFNLRSFADSSISLPGLALEKFALVSADEHTEVRSNFDITLYAIDDSEQLQLVMVYNADLFAPETIARMLARLRTLLESVTAQPNQALSTVPIITAEDGAKLSSSFTEALE